MVNGWKGQHQEAAAAPHYVFMVLRSGENVVLASEVSGNFICEKADYADKVH